MELKICTWVAGWLFAIPLLALKFLVSPFVFEVLSSAKNRNR